VDRTDTPQFTLAIESAIAGGSLSLLDGTGREIANWVGGDADVARAEDLLINIDGLLSSVGVSKRDLALIAVSAGPGSFTGIRIGMATALGLKKGLSIPMCSASVLHSIVIAKGYLAPGPSNWVYYAGVPSGRNAIALQAFEVGEWSQKELAAPVTIKDSDLSTFICDAPDFHFFLHAELVETLGASGRVTDVGRNLAECVAIDCFANRRLTEPLFISKSF